MLLWEGGLLENNILLLVHYRPSTGVDCFGYILLSLTETGRPDLSCGADEETKAEYHARDYTANKHLHHYLNQFIVFIFSHLVHSCTKSGTWHKSSICQSHPHRRHLSLERYCAQPVCVSYNQDPRQVLEYESVIA